MTLNNNQVYTRRSKKIRAAESPKDSFYIFPDNVVSIILSFLPIKDAVRTSVLSRNWEHMWTSIFDMVIDDKHKSLREADMEATFLNFMSRVFLGTRNSRLRLFRLSLSRCYHQTYLETWISEVIRRNVEILAIRAPDIQALDSGWCFNGWTSLTELSLFLSCTLTVQVNSCFLNLKKLCLTSGFESFDHGRIKINTEHILDSTGRVILSFPVLEHLVLEHCDWMDVNYVKIHAPELIRLKISFLKELKNYKIEILATKLAVFESKNVGCVDDIVLTTPAITSVTLGDSVTDQTLVLRTHKLLRQFPDLTCLKLSGSVIKALLQLKSQLVFPAFDRLKEFHAFYDCEIKDVFELLQLLPPLEILGLCDLWPTVDWKTPEALSPKIVSNLKSVEIGPFYVCEWYTRLVKFILENVAGLKELVVSSNPTEFPTMDRRLSKLIPKSSGCKLVLRRATDSRIWSVDNELRTIKSLATIF